MAKYSIAQGKRVEVVREETIIQKTRNSGFVTYTDMAKSLLKNLNLMMKVESDDLKLENLEILGVSDNSITYSIVVIWYNHLKEETE